MEEQEKKDVKQYFEKREEVLLAYVFGSHAREDYSPESDFDFGVLLRKGSNSRCRFEMASELEELLDGQHVDVVLMGRAPIELAYNIISEGRLIFEKSQEIRVNFESRLMSKYCDYLPVLRAQRRDVLREAGA